MIFLFWISGLFIAYTYIGYPLWLFLRSRGKTSRMSPPSAAAACRELPLASIVIAAHNEAGNLPRKLKNLAELDYPAERYEIIVVSDGSTDATDEWMGARANDRLRFFALPRHAGKAVALNRAMEAAKGRIVVFTDARQLLHRDAVRNLVSDFDDPDVGCVSGELMLGDPNRDNGGAGVGLYWKLEKKIREWESASGSVVGATGALYAVRKELLVPLPAGTVLDDVYLPIHVVRQGKRVLFEPRARVYDDLAKPGREFQRKTRTLTGNYQLLRLAPWLLTKGTPMRFRFLSHKLFRLWVPFALVALLVASVFLTGAFYRAALIAQLVFYAVGVLALLPRKFGFLSRVADLSSAFVLMNSAAAVALFWFLTNKKEVWAHAPASPPALKHAGDIPVELRERTASGHR